MILGIIASSIATAGGVTELYPQDNAASITTEFDDVGDWIINSGSLASSVGSGTTTAHSGDYCIMSRYVAGGGTYVNIHHNTIPVKLGYTYDISIWVKKGEGTTSDPAIRIYDLDVSNGQQNITSTSWVELTWTLLAIADGFMDIRAYSSLSVNDVPNSIYLDDISVVESFVSLTNEYPSGNSASIPETDSTSGYTNDLSGVITSVSSGVDEDTYALRVTAGGTAWAHSYINLTGMTGSTEYRIYFRGRASRAGGEMGLNVSGSHFTASVTVTVDTTSWADYVLVATKNSGTTGAIYILATQATVNSGDWVEINNIRVEAQV